MELYRILNCKDHSDIKTITKAYYKIGYKFRRNKITEDTSKEFQTICESFRLLKDHRTKNVYDIFGDRILKILRDERFGKLFSIFCIFPYLVFYVFSVGILLLQYNFCTILYELYNKHIHYIIIIPILILLAGCSLILSFVISETVALKFASPYILRMRFYLFNIILLQIALLSLIFCIDWKSENLFITLFSFGQIFEVFLIFFRMMELRRWIKMYGIHGNLLRDYFITTLVSYTIRTVTFVLFLYYNSIYIMYPIILLWISMLYVYGEIPKFLFKTLLAVASLYFINLYLYKMFSLNIFTFGYNLLSSSILLVVLYNYKVTDIKIPLPALDLSRDYYDFKTVNKLSLQNIFLNLLYFYIWKIR